MVFLRYCIHKNGMNEQEVAVTLIFDPLKSDQFILEPKRTSVPILKKPQRTFLRYLVYENLLNGHTLWLWLSPVPKHTV